MIVDLAGLSDCFSLFVFISDTREDLHMITKNTHTSDCSIGEVDYLNFPNVEPDNLNLPNVEPGRLHLPSVEPDHLNIADVGQNYLNLPNVEPDLLHLANVEPEHLSLANVERDYLNLANVEPHSMQTRDCFLRQVDYLNLSNVEPHSKDRSFKVCRDLMNDESFSNESGCHDWIKQFMALGSLDSDKEKAVHRCCELYGRLKSFAVCQDIVERGFNVNAADVDGMTLLHVAFLQNNYLLVYFLLEKGARITSPDSNNELPFMSSSFGAIVEDYFILKLKPLIPKSRECRIRHLRVCQDWNENGKIKCVISIYGRMPINDMRKLNRTVKNGVGIVVKEINSSESKMMQMYETGTTHSAKRTYLSADCAASLFNNHSNLNMVSVSSIKSIRFGRKYHSISKETCITLYCDNKGLIPIGEDKFPTRIGKYVTDVREGYCSFAANELTHGETIKRSAFQKTGTLGGFVNLPNGREGFLTCAHVLHSLDELYSSSFKKGENVALVKNSREYNIGKIEDAVFLTGRPSDVSVDAAIVEINDNARGSGNFPIIDARQRNITGKIETTIIIPSVKKTLLAVLKSGLTFQSLFYILYKICEGLLYEYRYFIFIAFTISHINHMKMYGLRKYDNNFFLSIYLNLCFANHVQRPQTYYYRSLI